MSAAWAGTAKGPHHHVYENSPDPSAGAFTSPGTAQTVFDKYMFGGAGTHAEANIADQMN